MFNCEVTERDDLNRFQIPSDGTATACVRAEHTQGRAAFWQAYVLARVPSDAPLAETPGTPAGRALARDARWTVVTRWGRIGTNGQTKRYWFRDRAEATADVGYRLNEKLRKGYDSWRVRWRAHVRAAAATVWGSRRNEAHSASGRAHLIDRALPAVDPLAVERLIDLEDDDG